MNPVVDELSSCKPFALCDLIFVVREDIIDAACMQVEMLAKVLHGHCRTFNVPTRGTKPPRALPCHLTPWLGRFPQGEVFRVMTVHIYPFAHSSQHVFEQVS